MYHSHRLCSSRFKTAVLSADSVPIFDTHALGWYLAHQLVSAGPQPYSVMCRDSLSQLNTGLTLTTIHKTHAHNYRTHTHNYTQDSHPQLQDSHPQLYTRLTPTTTGLTPTAIHKTHTHNYRDSHPQLYTRLTPTTTGLTLTT